MLKKSGLFCHIKRLVRKMFSNIQFPPQTTEWIYIITFYLYLSFTYPEDLVSHRLIYKEPAPQWCDKGQSLQRAASPLKPLIGPGQFRSHLWTLCAEWQSTHNGLNHPHTGYRPHSQSNWILSPGGIRPGQAGGLLRMSPHHECPRDRGSSLAKKLHRLRASMGAVWPIGPS